MSDSAIPGMRPFEAAGISKPLGAWTLKEMEQAANETSADSLGPSWEQMIVGEMRHFNVTRVGNLPWQAIISYGIALRCFDSEEAAFAYVESMRAKQSAE